MNPENIITSELMDVVETGIVFNIIKKYMIAQIVSKNIQPLCHWLEIAKDKFNFNSYNGLTNAIIKMLDQESIKLLDDNYKDKKSKEYKVLFGIKEINICEQIKDHLFSENNMTKLKNKLVAEDINSVFVDVLNKLQNLDDEQESVCKVINDVDEFIFVLLKSLTKEINDYDFFCHDTIKMFTYLKEMSTVFKNDILKKVNYMLISNAKFMTDYNNYILKTDKFNSMPYLTKVLEILNNKLSYKDEYLEKKKKMIETYLKELFIIFPCCQDKTPKRKRWNILTHKESMNIYGINNEIYNMPHAEKNGIGAKTGSESGYVVVDVDMKNEGMSTFISLTKENGLLNELDIDTLTVRTGGGGLHYYFEWELDMKTWHSMNHIFSSGDKKVGIDFRTDDGYVIVPPSIHPNGNIYEFIGSPVTFRDKIKKMPLWLKNKLNIWFIEHPSTKIKTRHFCDLYKTAEICEKYVGENGYNLFRVPDKFVTHDLCIIAMKKRVPFRSIPMKYKTDELFYKMVTDDNLVPNIIERLKSINPTHNLLFMEKCIKINDLCKKYIDEINFNFSEDEKKMLKNL